MYYRKIDMRKLYEQTSEPVSVEHEGIVKGAAALNQDKPATEDEEVVKSALYGFPIGSDELTGINSLISSGKGEWRSTTPLKLMQTGKESEAATMKGKPVHLMIRIGTMKDRASNEIQLIEDDKVYVLFNTSAEELNNYLEYANSIDKRIRITVKTPYKMEHSLELWKDPTSIENAGHSDFVDMKDGSENTVSVDLNAQIENPGTAAGIGESLESGEPVFDNFDSFDKAVNERRDKAKDKSGSFKFVKMKPVTIVKQGEDGEEEKITARDKFKVVSLKGVELLRPNGELTKEAYEFVKRMLAKEGYTDDNILRLTLKKIKKSKNRDKILFTISRKNKTKESATDAATGKDSPEEKAAKEQELKDAANNATKAAVKTAGETAKKNIEEPKKLIAKKSSSLKVGSKGSSVSNLQGNLIWLGHKITKDGKYGPATKAAVKSLQKKAFPNDETQWDGVYGPKTNVALKKLILSKSKTKKKDDFNIKNPADTVSATDTTSVKNVAWPQLKK